MYRAVVEKKINTVYITKIEDLEEDRSRIEAILIDDTIVILSENIDAIINTFDKKMEIKIVKECITCLGDGRDYFNSNCPSCKGLGYQRITKNDNK